jgi:hypothetical protein
MTQSLEISILWWLSILLQGWIAIRIFRGSLFPALKFFAIYVSLSASFSIFLALFANFSTNKNLYGYCFISWTYASSIFEFLVILELSSKALEPFPAIKAASRKILTAFWVVLILVGGAWFVYLNSLPTQKKTSLLLPALRYQESVALGFTLFILLFLLNHCFLMGAFFLLITLSRFAIKLGDFLVQKEFANYIGLGGTLIVFILWLARIRASDDHTLNTPKGPLDPAEAAVLISRLEELNRTLARSGTSPRGIR